MKDWTISEFNAAGLNLRGKSSGQIKIKCPFCPPTRTNKNDTSLSVNIDTGQYNCHYCNSHGNIHKYATTEKKYVRPEWTNKTSLTKEVVDWFAGRGISQETLLRAKITQTTEWMPQTQKKAGVICFNYFKDGELINIKYRDREKNFKMVKDAEKTWYNHDAVYGKEIIIVEGEMDALSFMEVGLSNVVSVPNGASNYEFFDLKTLENIQKFYLAVDNDHSGIQLKADLIRRIGAERCLVIEWGDCKDANEFLVKKGKNQLREILSTAKEVPVSGILYAHNFSAEIEDMWKNGLQPGKKVGHRQLDELITFETGRLMVVTGIPSHGKSEFVDEILTRLCVKQEWKAGYFTPENFPLQVHISKLVAKIHGAWIDRLSAEELQTTVDYIDENFFWVFPEEEEFTLDVILKKTEYLVRKHGINAFVIDPWNTIDHQLGSLSETQYISAALSKLTVFCKKFDLLMILVAHPKKMEKTQGVYEVPNLYSISGSSHFFNKADFGITVYRTQGDDVQVHVQKVKFRHLGHTGMVEFRNNFNNGRYQEVVEGAMLSWNNEPFFEVKEIPSHTEAAWDVYESKTVPF